jgi:hypothetical protein
LLSLTRRAAIRHVGEFLAALNAHPFRPAGHWVEGTMGTREEIIAAQDAWRDAKRAYDDEAAQYVGVAWLPSVARPGPVDGLTREACERLTQLVKRSRPRLRPSARFSTTTDSRSGLG